MQNKNNVTPITGAISDELRAELLQERLDSIPERAIRWTIPNVIAKKFNTLFAGIGGVGKSLITAHTISSLTNGTEFAGSGFKPRQSSAIYLSKEEYTHEVAKPRLMAAGTNPEALFIPKGIHSIYDFEKLGEKIAGINALANQPTVRLIVLDTSADYLGDQINMYDAVQVRKALYSLTWVAMNFNLSFIVTHHMSKGTGSANDKIFGSQAFRNYFRNVWVAGKDEESGELRFGQNKANNNRIEDGFIFEIKDKSRTIENIQTSIPYVSFTGERCNPNMDSCFSENNRRSDKLDDASEFIWTTLSTTEWMLSDDLNTAATEAGISERTLKRALKENKDMVQSSKREIDGKWMKKIKSMR